MRVMHLIRDIGPGFGGAEAVVFELAMRLDPDRHQRYVCITRAPSPELEATVADSVELLEAAGVSVLRLGRGSSADLSPWRRFHGALRRERIDLLHSHMFRANVPGAIVRRAAGVPLHVAHDHSWAFEGRLHRRMVDRVVVAGLADLVVAVSEADRQSMIRAQRFPRDRIRVVPNGLPTSPERHGGDVRGELGIAPAAPLVLAVGLLRPEKRHEDLIEATALLRSEMADVVVAIAGEGPARHRLEAAAERYGVADAVKLLGARRDVPDLLAHADAAVLCSEREGSPLALFEYMRAGVPTVATHVGGVVDAIDDGVHGLLVPPRAPRELATALAELLGDRARARALGNAARLRQASKFNMDRMVRTVEELYAELAEGAGRRVRAGRS